MPPIYLTEDDVASLLTMDMALEAVEIGFRKLGLDEATNVPRTRCQTDHVMLHVLSAAVKSLGVIGFKAYRTSASGAQFQVSLFDGRTGELLALMEADYLGQVRTGAASGVATKWLAHPDANRLGLFGTGKQACTQLEAIHRVRPLRQALVYSSTEAHRNQFADRMSERLNLEVLPVSDPRQAAEGLDLVCTATNSRTPVLFGEWLQPGIHLNVIGSNFLAKSEIDLEVIRRADRIIVDQKEQARLEAGDLYPAVQQGILKWLDVQELAQIVSRRQPGRTDPSQITLFKSLGLGIEDIVVAGQVYARALAEQVGRPLFA